MPPEQGAPAPGSGGGEASRPKHPDAVRLGVVGLGRGFMSMAPTLLGDPRVRIVGVAEPRESARSRFAADFGVAAHADIAALCADPAVEAVYVASPHQFHRDHVELAAGAGKDVLLEKPIATTLADCEPMLEAVERAGVRMLVGHTHAYDPPVRAARALIRDGRFGALRMINGWAFTDFLYRPRRPEELDTARGGGVIFNQAPHHIDVVRLLGGGLLRSVRAVAGAWDARRPTEGAYTAFLEFESGAVASLVYSGYAHFDSDEIEGWIGEDGASKSPAGYGAARRLLASLGADGDEARLKGDTGYGGPHARPLTPDPGAGRGSDAGGVGHQHFGVLVASCERADVRPGGAGLTVYGDAGVEHHPLRDELGRSPRATVVDDLVAAVRQGAAPVHDGPWATATLEACLAILESSRTGREIRLSRQCPPGDERD